MTLTRIFTIFCVLWVIPCLSFASFESGNEAFSRGDYSVALAEWRQAANDGDVRAINSLGFMYLNGIGVSYDAVTAVKYFKQAVDDFSDPMAMTNLGWLRVTGEGVEQDLASGVRLLQAASRESVPAALYYLAILYQSGYGVDRDLVESCQLGVRAAEAEFSDAFAMAGICFEEGAGVSKDLGRAVHYYRVAAGDHGNPGAQVSLARLLLSGEGVERNYNEARQLLVQASKQNPGATILLGDLYFFGKGVVQNDRTAVELYAKALNEIAQIEWRPNSDWFLDGLNDASFVTGARENLSIARHRLETESQSSQTQRSDLANGEPAMRQTIIAASPEDEPIQSRNTTLQSTQPSEADEVDGNSVGGGTDNSDQAPEFHWDRIQGFRRTYDPSAGPAGLPGGSEVRERAVNSEGDPTMRTYTLILAGQLVPVMLIYSLIFLLFKKAMGLRYATPTFLAGIVISWNLTAIPVLWFGQELLQVPGNALLIPLVSAIAVIFAILLRQKYVTGVANVDGTTSIDTDESPPDTESSSAYERAWNEIESGHVEKGLWAQCFADAGGQETKAKASYIEQRAGHLVGAPNESNKIRRGAGWTLLILSAFAMAMCTSAGPEMRDFVLSPAGAWTWLAWLAMLIGGVVLKHR